jgi:hypothetical protein
MPNHERNVKFTTYSEGVLKYAFILKKHQG